MGTPAEHGEGPRDRYLAACERAEVTGSARASADVMTDGLAGVASLLGFLAEVPDLDAFLTSLVDACPDRDPREVAAVVSLIRALQASAGTPEAEILASAFSEPSDPEAVAPVEDGLEAATTAIEGEYIGHVTDANQALIAGGMEHLAELASNRFAAANQALIARGIERVAELAAERTRLAAAPEMPRTLWPPGQSVAATPAPAHAPPTWWASVAA